MRSPIYPLTDRGQLEKEYEQCLPAESYEGEMSMIHEWFRRLLIWSPPIAV